MASNYQPMSNIWQAALRAAFALALIALPIQKALLFQQFSAGLSPFETAALFPADLAVVFLLLVWGLKSIIGRQGQKFSTGERPLLLAGLAFLIFTLGSVLLAPWLYLGLAQWFHVAFGLGLFAFARSEWRNVKSIALPLIIGIASLEALAALSQFAFQHSVGLQILGETVANPTLPGIAKISLGAERVIRAYGTFSHPNVLAAFLGVSMLWLTGWYLNKRPRSSAGEILFWATLALLLAGLLVTFSRTAIILTLLALLGLLIWQWLHGRPKADNFERKRLLGIAGVVLIGCLGFTALFFPLVSQRAAFSADDQAVALRLYYLKVAAVMVENRPLLGVGTGNFVPALRQYADPRLPAWAFQPVHNLYALIVAEAGLPALISFLAIIGLVMWQWRRAALARAQPLKRAFLIAAGILILASLLDHYAWTTGAGRYLWWLVLGVI